MNSKLREARSTPYIGSVPEEIHKKHKEEVHHLPTVQNLAGSVENFALKMNGIGIGIQMGSSSSTDLSDFVFYNDSCDPEVMEQWAKLYQAQKECSSTQTTTSPFAQIQQINKNYSDSADNLFKQNYQRSSTSTCNSTCMPDGSENYSTEKDDVHSKHSVNHRSMDVLPIIRDNFRLLEKCCSVDLPTSNKQIPPSKLSRSKELPNLFSVIADEDD